MNNETWTRVDQYLAGQLLQPDEALEAALRSSDAAGLPSINVSPTQGALLQMLARLCGARRILEIGTLGGYSTIWLARALPAGGRLITLEADEQHAAVARANIGRAGLAGVVEIRSGGRSTRLPVLARESRTPFDLTFIDADKANTPEYFTCGPEHVAPRQPDHRRQRRPERGSRGRVDHGRKRAGHAAVSSTC